MLINTGCVEKGMLVTGCNYTRIIRNRLDADAVKMIVDPRRMQWGLRMQCPFFFFVIN